MWAFGRYIGPRNVFGSGLITGERLDNLCLLPHNTVRIMEEGSKMHGPHNLLHTLRILCWCFCCDDRKSASGLPAIILTTSVFGRTNNKRTKRIL